MSNTEKLKELVTNGKLVHFTRYRKGFLYYQTECGFEFPVPVDDIGDATFEATFKAMTLMRYIRKHLEEVEKAVSEIIIDSIGAVDA